MEDIRRSIIHFDVSSEGRRVPPVGYSGVCT